MNSTYVPPTGSLNAKYVLVGEQPGRYEVRMREPFCGPAGKNIQECFQKAGISWGNVYRTNVIKDLGKPLVDYLELVSGKRQKVNCSPEARGYIEILKAELEQTTANIIIAAGNVALWALCSRIGITNWRGSVLESTLLPGRKVIPTIHPATWTQEKLYKNPGAYLNKYLVTHDLKRARDEVEFPEIRRPGVKLIIKPSYYDVMSYIDSCIEYGLRGAVIDYDIELTPFSQELSCIGLAYGSHEAICIPFVDHRGDYFNIEEECNIMAVLNYLFSNPHIRKRGQNVIFDSHYLLKKYGIRTYGMEDTMVAQAIIAPEFRKGLDFITSMWTNFPYYKQDGKLWLDGVGEYERGWEYNCYDVLSCATAHSKQLERLKEQHNIRTYERQVRLIPPLTYMMEHGIKVDVLGMHEEAVRCKHEAEILTEQVHRKMGKEINLASPKQVGDYFYVTKRIEPYLSNVTGKPTVDVIALKRIANKGYEEARMILEIRRLEKRVSTFLDVQQVDKDGRIRCSYNPVGTKFGRISSSENIFGTGTNLQNQPHDVLTFFVVDEGYIGYSLDMSQIENRIVAYVGNILPMIHAFESGMDVHRLTAALVLNVMGIPRRYEEVTPEERQELGKRPNHAFNYGYGYRSFSLKYEVPEIQAKQTYNGYHGAYPGLRRDYWGYVEKCLRRDRHLENLLGRVIPFFGMWSDTMLNEAKSAIPQSTCGDLVNGNGIEFAYYNQDLDFRHVELMTQIHDSMEIQMPLSVPLSTHARVLIAIKKSLETELHFEDRSFSVPVDLVVTKCLNKEKGVELKGPKFSTDPEVLERNLAEAITRLGLQYAY